jgi:Protein of unknown function (DUF3306)
VSSGPAQANRFSLRRWSQRKLEAARTEGRTPMQAPPPADIAAAVQTPAGPHAAIEPTVSASVSNSVSTPAANADLPPIESLTIDSDFAPFFKPQVDESVKRAALKQLFRDPRFNIMDGLDTYIDDYTQPDPIPSAMLEELMQRRGFFAPSAAEAVPGGRAVDEPAGNIVAPSAEAIAPPVAADARLAPDSPIAPGAPVASLAPVAPADAPRDANSAPETGVDDKSAKS